MKTQGKWKKDWNFADEIKMSIYGDLFKKTCIYVVRLKIFNVIDIN